MFFLFMTSALFGAAYSDELLLHKAAEDGDLKSVKKLLEEYYDIDAQDNNGWTPLHYAASKGHIKVLVKLLSGDAEFTIKNDKGQTPFDVGSKEVQDLIHIWSVLQEEEAFSDEDLTEEEINSIILLIPLIYDDGDGEPEWPPLNHAVWHEMTRVVIEMLNRGADVNSKTDMGETPLDFAIRRQNVRIVGELLSRGANPNPEGDGFTPLHSAAHYGSMEVVKLLLKAGANPDVQDENGKRPEDVAGNEEIKKFLKEERSH